MCVDSSPFRFNQSWTLEFLLSEGKGWGHVTSFKVYSRLITMAVDHFPCFCCAIERRGGPTLSHARLPSILLQLPSNRWLHSFSCSLCSHTQRMEPPQECQHKRRNVILLSATPQTNGRVRRSTPQVQACLNTGGKKSYYDFFFLIKGFAYKILYPIFETLSERKCTFLCFLIYNMCVIMVKRGNL